VDNLCVLRRIWLIPSKVKEKGLRWLWSRVGEEIDNSVLGRAYRGIRLKAVSALVRSLREFRDRNQDTLFVFYDLGLYPISFDVCWFLMWAEPERKRRGLEKIHLVFVPRKYGELRDMPASYSEVVDTQSRFWRLHNIAVPLALMLPSCSGVTVGASRLQAEGLRITARHQFPDKGSWPASLYDIFRSVIEGLERGRTDWGFRASVQGLRYIQQWTREHARGRKIIVITLRQYLVDPERNSDLKSWAAFARGLDPDKYLPVFVPDTDHAFDALSRELEGLVVFDAPAWNLGLRMALYETAYLNMFVNTGPGSLCILSRTCRYLFFKVMVSSVYLTSERHLRDLGFAKGTTPPFATPFQKWVWEDDSLEVIEHEFAAMCRILDGSREPVIAKPETASAEHSSVE
jgi:hypothetical protein